jgi:hypothetical protein
MNFKLRYVLAVIIVALAIIFTLFAYEYTQRNQALLDHDTAADLPADFYDLSAEETVTEALATEDPEDRANYLFRTPELLKKTDPTNIAAIIAAYAMVYEYETLSAEDRALALFKISQQANGNNRFDLMDQFLEAGQTASSSAEKNYLLNQKIYEMHPMGIVYTDITLHEILRGDEYNRHAVYAKAKELLEADTANYADKARFANLVPDLYLHTAVLLAAIDEISVPGSYVSSAEILSLLDQGELACDTSRFLSGKCTTRDFIQLTRIDYLLKMNEVAQAEEAVIAFLASDLRPMIRSYITEKGGLTLGRFKHLEAHPDIVTRLTTTIPTLPDPT